MKSLFNNIFRKPDKSGTMVRDLAFPQAIHSADDWHPGQMLMEEFIVQQTLGEGGMGKVYLLRSESSGAQFAVKRAKGLDSGQRRQFLAELQTWIDLPEHPNLVPCRFFRTLGDEVLIFAEYVEGGSLQEWILSRKLYAGGQRQALEQMLDVAIQFAWGLHCLHEFGFVHQDVKPGNVMMGADHRAAILGVRPMVTDFGLARAKAAAGERYVAELGRSVLVSCGGGTPAYWSPEQAQGLALTQKTDMWSWGLSVLEMFAGGVSWTYGQEAAEALDRHLKNRVNDEAIPPMPSGLANLLKACFSHDQTQRLESLAEAVERLRALFEKTTGSSYGRELTVTQGRAFVKGEIIARSNEISRAWTDPKEWLEKALRAAGRDPAEASDILSKQGVTRRGQMVVEIAIYDEAKRLFEHLVRGGRKELEPDLADLCIDKASVHQTAADGTGALQECNHCIAILERLVNQENRNDLARALAFAYGSKGLVFGDFGDFSGAAAAHAQEIAVLERLVNQLHHFKLSSALAHAIMNRATAFSELGDLQNAAALDDQAVAIYERLVIQEDLQQLAGDLAGAYTNKGTTLRDLGEYRAAIEFQDKAIVIYERLVKREEFRKLSQELAMAYMSKANALSDLGDHQATLALFDKSIAIWEYLVNEESRHELANELAKVYMNKGNALSDLGQNRAAVDLYDQAIAIRERLVNQEGRGEIASYLAGTYCNKGRALNNLGESHTAIVHYSKAIAIYEKLMDQEGRREIAHYLAKAYMRKTEALRNTGNNKEAVLFCDRAIAILNRLVNLERRNKFAGDLDSAMATRTMLLSKPGETMQGE